MASPMIPAAPPAVAAVPVNPAVAAPAFLTSPADTPTWPARAPTAVKTASRPAAAVAPQQAERAFARTGVALAVAAISGVSQKARRQRRRARASQVRRHQADARVTHPSLAVEAAVRAPLGRYCEATEQCVRRKTRTVTIGAVKIGSEHRIATQTMANTLTHEVEATVAQIKKCADAGIDIVRVTVQGMREAKACEHIKRRLLEDGYTTPIVADIHFTPKVAMVVADHVDKVRVNPGNFADGRKSFDTISELTEKDIQEARAAIEEALVPLVLKLKMQNKALRIGVNHGSMSERILFQYGDSPEGMVASAVEFGEICRKHDFHNFVFSMKSSNPQVMVQAYRQLAREMYKRGWDYPLHLGVTEAGGGSDGRIKSAVGIGALLLDGLGDTVRVSLTEDPELEAGPCTALRRAAEGAVGKGVAEPFLEGPSRRDGRFERRVCEFPLDVPLNTDGSVLALITADMLQGLETGTLCKDLGLHLRADGDVQKDWKSVDAVVIDESITEPVAGKVKDLLNVPIGVLCSPGAHVPDGATLLHECGTINEPLPQRLGGHAVIFSGEEPVEVIEATMRLADPRVVLLRPKQHEGVTFVARRFFATLASLNLPRTVPVMLWFRYSSLEAQGSDDVVVRASADFGSLFVDGLGEGLLWEAGSVSADELRESSFNLLQASRMRISKTEFISCPSCGRTLFDLQETTAKIQKRTGHLPGVRIAVMGCIVNGPGEMADADFGYVGSGVGKVDLYVGYNCVRRGIPSENAVDALESLIREHGRWQDPPEQSEEGEDSVKVLGVQLVRDAL